ncbi:Uncharacterised protein [Mycobacterium tuberculosis]|nr:Uncharacterised protein [Mycobacterium tuberculosis]
MWPFVPFNFTKVKPFMELAEGLLGIAHGNLNTERFIKRQQFFIVNKLASN